MNPYWQTADGRHVLYLGDNLSVLPSLETGSIQAIITDPPYGINAGNMNLGKWRTSRMPKSDWDAIAPDLSPVLALDVQTIIWGGNYFPLPQSRCFLVWDKGAGFYGRDFSECEMAWCNRDSVARIFRHDPLASGDYRNKLHPTQKPLAVMLWCLSLLDLPEGATVFDPYAGSGTTLVACARTGRRSIGIEIDEQYAQIAARRMEAELASCPLFGPAPQTFRQGTLLEGQG